MMKRIILTGLAKYIKENMVIICGGAVVRKIKTQKDVIFHFTWRI